jgi:hypothetical protein
VAFSPDWSRLSLAPQISASSEKMIGVQIGAASFVDEGVNQVLDILQKRGQVNTLFLAVFTYDRGAGGRQVVGRPLPDHGPQEYPGCPQSRGRRRHILAKVFWDEARKSFRRRQSS